MQSDFLEYNIAVIPDAPSCAKIIEWSQKIGATFEAEVVLDGESTIPHISLYHVGFPPENKNAIDIALADAMKLQESFEVITKAFEPVVYWKSIDISFVRNPSLVKLQDRIISTVSHHRGSVVRPSAQRVLDDPDAPQAFKESVQRTGYYASGEAFNPHITFVRLADAGNIPQAIESITFEPIKWTVEAVALCTIGEYGTVPEIQKTLSFS